MEKRKATVAAARALAAEKRKASQSPPHKPCGRQHVEEGHDHIEDEAKPVDEGEHGDEEAGAKSDKPEKSSRSRCGSEAKDEEGATRIS